MGQTSARLVLTKLFEPLEQSNPRGCWDLCGDSLCGPDDTWGRYFWYWVVWWALVVFDTVPGYRRLPPPTPLQYFRKTFVLHMLAPKARKRNIGSYLSGECCSIPCSPKLWFGLVPEISGHLCSAMMDLSSGAWCTPRNGCGRLPRGAPQLCNRINSAKSKLPGTDLDPHECVRPKCASTALQSRFDFPRKSRSK